MWLSRIYDPDIYCLFFDMPKQWYTKADMTLASVLGTSFLWVPYVNDTLTMIGLGLGVFIASVRAFKALRDIKLKD